MADYSGAYESPANIEIATLRHQNRMLQKEVDEYKRKDVENQRKQLDYGLSPIQYHVECNKCFAAVREVKMPDHRDRCK